MMFFPKTFFLSLLLSSTAQAQKLRGRRLGGVVGATDAVDWSAEVINDLNDEVVSLQEEIQILDKINSEPESSETSNMMKPEVYKPILHKEIAALEYESSITEDLIALSKQELPASEEEIDTEDAEEKAAVTKFLNLQATLESDKATLDTLVPQLKSTVDAYNRPITYVQGAEWGERAVKEANEEVVLLQTQLNILKERMAMTGSETDGPKYFIKPDQYYPIINKEIEWLEMQESVMDDLMASLPSEPDTNEDDSEETKAAVQKVVNIRAFLKSDENLIKSSLPKLKEDVTQLMGMGSSE